MAGPKERLAESLEKLQELQGQGVAAIRSRDLSRTHRERLVRSGLLNEVIKGWYIPSRPDEAPGDSTAWYASFWDFCAVYLSERFDRAWCLSPEHSLLLHAGNRSVPAQLLVRTPKGGNKPTTLPHGTSILDIRAAMPKENEIVERGGLRLYAVPAALVATSGRFFRSAPTDARTALAIVKDASDVLAPLLEGGHSTIAGRLGGAFRNIGRTRLADEIIKTMEAAGYTVREKDPFENERDVGVVTREASPYVNRIRLMWEAMRQSVLDIFPEPPYIRENKQAYLKAIDQVYLNDAYHSLSIEGYRVSPELIERVRSGAWNPENNAEDHENRNSLAARGYCDAFLTVKASVEKVLGGESAGAVARDDHSEWYRQLFGPSVTAGIIKPADLAGYRSGPVFIKRSMHVPPPRDALGDLMPVLFDCIEEEVEPSVRVVLGHFIFVYIHPYMDGNGRMGRFLMNVMLAAGGYDWTIIPLERRGDYMSALESASVDQNIKSFAEFLAGLVEAGLQCKSVVEIPAREQPSENDSTPS